MQLIHMLNLNASSAPAGSAGGPPVFDGRSGLRRTSHGFTLGSLAKSLRRQRPRITGSCAGSTRTGP